MAAPYDLVSLAGVQAWLGQTSDSVNLGALITQVSRAILTSLGRASILPTSYLETRDGDGHRALILRNWPVLSVNSLVVNGQAIAATAPLSLGSAVQSGYVLEQADLTPPGRMQALLLRDAWFCRGAQNVSVTYRAGYQVTGEAAVVPVSPATIAAQAPFGAWASDGGVTYANGGALAPVAGAPGLGQYSVAGGVYTFSVADAGASVLLTYGFVPADLGEATLEWVAERYAYKAHIGQKSKSLGGQETVSYDLSAVPAFVAAALQPYRRIASPC